MFVHGAHAPYTQPNLRFSSQKALIYTSPSSPWRALARGGHPACRLATGVLNPIPKQKTNVSIKLQKNGIKHTFVEGQFLNNGVFTPNDCQRKAWKKSTGY